MRCMLCAAICGFGLLAGAAVGQDADLGAGEDEGPDAPVRSDPYRGFFSHGYLRVGIGDSDGDGFRAFKLNGAQSKYRLGNESDIYSEFGLGWRGDLGNGSEFVGEVMLNGFGDSNAINNNAAFAGGSDVVQAYAGIERLGDGALSDAFLWAGRRFYRRRDVHMSDFYYENMSGDGIGLENARVGKFGLSTAAFYHDEDSSDYRSAALDVRAHDIPLGGTWAGEVGLAWIDGRGTDQTGDDGYSVRLHAENAGLGWGEFKAALMYGAGAGLDFNSTGAAYAESGDNRVRFVSQALIVSNEKLESQATAVWDRSDIAGETVTWVSAGIRPQYHFTNDWGAALELGYDWVDDESDTRSLTKVTLAPFYSFGKTGFFARPQLRAFVTWANWSDAGAITEQAAFGGATDGMSYGIQLEHWW